MHRVYCGTREKTHTYFCPFFSLHVDTLSHKHKHAGNITLNDTGAHMPVWRLASAGSKVYSVNNTASFSSVPSSHYSKHCGFLSHLSHAFVLPWAVCIFKNCSFCYPSVSFCLCRGFPGCENPSADRLWSDLWQHWTLPWCKWNDHRFSFQRERPLGQCGRPAASAEVHGKEAWPSKMKDFCWQLSALHVLLHCTIALWNATLKHILPPS